MEDIALCERGDEEAMLLLAELTDADVHCYDDTQDVLRCVLCGYQHRLFDAEVSLQQKQHYAECLVVRAKMLLARGKKEQQA